MTNTSNITVIDHEYIAQHAAADKNAVPLSVLRFSVIGLGITIVATFVAAVISTL